MINHQEQLIIINYQIFIQTFITKKIMRRKKIDQYYIDFDDFAAF